MRTIERAAIRDERTPLSTRPRSTMGMAAVCEDRNEAAFVRGLRFEKSPSLGLQVHKVTRATSSQLKRNRGKVTRQSWHRRPAVAKGRAARGTINGDITKPQIAGIEAQQWNLVLVIKPAQQTTDRTMPVMLFATTADPHTSGILLDKDQIRTYSTCGRRIALGTWALMGTDGH